MAICPYCGSENADTNAFCSECGGPLKEQQVPVAPEPPAQPFEAPVQTPVQPQSAASFTAPSEPVAPIPTGGLMAWAIVTLLLCLVAGIVALMEVNKINKSTTVEEQQKHVSTARTWCIVGTVIGVLSILGRMMNQ